MKTTIWTRGKMAPCTYPDGSKGQNWENKCIWKGEMNFIPNKGMDLYIKDGWGGLTVDRVAYSIYNNTLEIHVDTTDPNDEWEDVWNKEEIPTEQSAEYRAGYAAGYAQAKNDAFPGKI